MNHTFTLKFTTIANSEKLLGYLDAVPQNMSLLQNGGLYKEFSSKKNKNANQKSKQEIDDIVNDSENFSQYF